MRLSLSNASKVNSFDALPFLVAAFCVIWSSAFAVAKVALSDCPPLLLLTMRFLIAGGIMLVVALLFRMRRPSWRDILIFSVLGVANNTVYLGLNYVGLGTISAGLSALIISANPVLTALLATLFLHENMTWRKAAGLVLGIGGVAFIVHARMGSGTESLSGIVLTISALVSLVTGTILFKLLAPKGGIWVGNAIQNMAGGLALAPVALLFEHFGDIAPSWDLFAALSYLTLVASILGFLLWFHLLNRVGATAASSYHFLMPPLGVFFGWLLLGEHVALNDFLGILPVAFGIYLVTRPASVSRISAAVPDPCVLTNP